MMSNEFAAMQTYVHAGAAWAVSVVSLLTLAMCVRLWRRHRAYRLMAAGITLALLQQLLHVDIVVLQAEGWPPLAEGSVRALSFLIINAAALELYQRHRRLDRLIACLLGLLVAGALALQLLPLSGSADKLLPPGGLPVPALHAAAMLAAVLALAGTLPRIGQQRTYGAAVAAYLLAGISLLAGDLYGGQPPEALRTVGLSLEAAYSLLLFIFVFESVLERWKSVYSSSIRDGLTGLYTRQHFIRKTERYLSRGFKIAVLFCDLDNFKRLNDTEGHQTADDVLKRVASIIAEETRGAGTAGRYGGEELVASIAHPKIKAATIAEAIRARVEKETPVTVSIGWSAVGSNGSLTDAIKRADEAMYKSKHSGKNKVTAHREPSSRTASGTPEPGDATRELRG